LAAFARWKQKERRFSRLARYRGPTGDLLATVTDFLLERRGENPRFADTKLRVPQASSAPAPSPRHECQNEGERAGCSPRGATTAGAAPTSSLTTMPSPGSPDAPQYAVAKVTSKIQSFVPARGP
jgi:hypothetical protein